MALITRVIAILTILVHAGLAATVTASVPVPTFQPPDSCVADIPSFQECSTFASIRQECFDKVSESAKLACLCTQNFVNQMYLCQNEYRICLQRSDMVDSDFEQAMGEWHTYCDARATVTTPPLATMTKVWDLAKCTSYFILCERAFSETDACSSSATAAVDFVSCVCRPEVTALYSSCFYDGRKECAVERVVMEDVPGYGVCLGFQGGMTSHGDAELASALSVFSWSNTGADGLDFSWSGTGEAMPRLTRFPTKTVSPSPVLTTTLPGASVESIALVGSGSRRLVVLDTWNRLVLGAAAVLWSSVFILGV